jgi:uncharacterized protein YdeI (YjbR/CyaY-like superfamily)
MKTINPKVDFIFNKETKWQTEYNALRKIILEFDFKEELKWGWPCYAFNDGGNVVLIHGFKEYCAIMFFKGSLLKDEKKLLVAPSENMQATRQLRFTNVKEIEKQKAVIKSYIKQAIDAEKAGLKVKMKTTAEYKMIDEFKIVLQKNLKVKKAFEALTPGRQRGYLFYFSQAKQAATREARIEKCIPNILNGKGLTD